MSEQQIKALVEALFTNGFGEAADRLVLMDDDEHRDLGGWCRGAVADRIREHTRATPPLAPCEPSIEEMYRAYHERYCALTGLTPEPAPLESGNVYESFKAIRALFVKEKLT